MLFFDDEPLPEEPSRHELVLTASLPEGAIQAIDEALLRKAKTSWLKVARVVVDAMDEAGYPLCDESYIHLHVRRIVTLVQKAALQLRGDARQPRWSEVRLPDES